MQTDMPPGGYEFYGDGYAPYPYPPPYPYYPPPTGVPRPYPYGGYGPTYIGNSSRARRARSAISSSGTSKSSESRGPQRERHIQQAAAGVVQAEQLGSLAVVGTVAETVAGTVAGNVVVASSGPAMSAHAPVELVSTPMVSPHAEEDDVPLSQVFRNARPDEHVNSYPNP